MPTEVIMPQMGESIFEGTITKWLKKPGDAVEKDEPLFEISTDKVDAEIPSPTAGVLQEIKIGEGETVQVNTVVAIIGNGAARPAAKPAAKPQAAQASQPQPKQESKPAPATVRAEAPAAESAPGQVNVIMPQMGESIFEGTITKWLKKAGDTVQKDEPLFEISTDKVDAEIPSPAAGVLREIKAAEGETVQVNMVVAVIGGAANALEQPDGQPSHAAPPTQEAATEARAEAPPAPTSMPGPAEEAESGPELSQESVRSSPLVRRMAREHNLDLRRIQGTGLNGRISKQDVLKYLKEGPAAPTAGSIAAKPITVTPAAAVTPGAPPAPLEGKLEPMSRMRTIIAQRMAESRRTAPHAYSIYKVDMTRVVRAREKQRAAFEQRTGVKLTYMPFIAAAAIDALRKFPIVNASIEGNAIRYHANIHLGIAVALEWGLIVPVVKEAERRNFRDLAATIADLAARARTKKLKPEEASGSTFTLTNSGVFGGEFGTPILNLPESAILAIGGLKKEPVVLTDAEGNDTIAIRSMQTYCLGFDHRLIDGADAGKFMTEFTHILEHWDRDLG
ncbi:MAG: 2-oxoglutarate dehydrogenase, E2 component, dihydrolipoamide succinyltransferase [Acidobacteriota bacterium]